MSATKILRLTILRIFDIPSIWNQLSISFVGERLELKSTSRGTFHAGDVRAVLHFCKAVTKQNKERFKVVSVVSCP